MHMSSSAVLCENTFDPIALTQRLIQFQSITPHDAGCMDFIEELLTPLGFICHRIAFGDGEQRVENFYARRGTTAPHLCFLGHTDVVPVGDLSKWSVDPFAAEIKDDHIIGRGACDMKGAIACFIAAIYHGIKDKDISGSISLLLTSDEEGPAQNGVKKMITWLKEKDEAIDFCLGGEPTNPLILGEMVKIGRRGSLSMALDVVGITGHVAYPLFALNPIQPLIAFLNHIQSLTLDSGTDEFDPSHLEITSIDVGNPTSNIIPGKASATLNIRFNPSYTLESLEAFLEKQLSTFKDAHDTRLVWHASYRPSAEAFLKNNPTFTNAVVAIIKKNTGMTPVLSTTGGTSDARFMKDLCPVLEFGLLSCYAHHIDERVALTDLNKLTTIYTDIITILNDLT